MKRMFLFFIILSLSVDNAFAAWLGWAKDDIRKQGQVMVFKYDTLGSNASSPEDFMNMVQYGDAILIDYGTKCYVLDRSISKAKVRVVSGTHEGYVGWVYIESLRE